MATDEFVLTENPRLAAELVRIDQVKYDRVREALLDNLRTHGSMTLAQLGSLVESQLQDDFDGSLGWYCTTVKLDLEACGALRNVPHSNPQKIEIA